MGDTFRDGKVHVVDKKCGQCAFSPGRIVPGARVADIVEATKDIPGNHFICHKTTIEGEGDAICRGWYDHLGDKDPILVLAKSMDIIEEQSVDNA